MAEKKPDKGGGGKDKGKPAGKPSGGSGGPSLEGTLGIIALVSVMVIFIILPAVFKLFGTTSEQVFPSDLGERITAGFEGTVTAASYISIFLSLAFICGIMYAQTMYSEIRRKMDEAAMPKKTAALPIHEQLVSAAPDPRWKDIEGLMQSGNPADWRVAILEADILLEDMLGQMGYSGESIGEKLKQVDPAHFKTIQDAWKAHKVRNTIAHEGAAFKLSRSSADEVIADFKRVFDEFYFV